jgi:lipopolysaccharide export system permease protein
LVRQTLVTVLMTVAIFTFVLLLGNVIREVFSLLMSEFASPKTMAIAVGLLIPYVLVFALPMGLLTAMLLTFGRLSADQELVAIRGSGISLVALVTPVLLLAVGFSCLSGFINMYLAPKSRTLYKDLLYDLSHMRPTTVLTEGRFVRDIPPYIIYVGKIKDGELHDILVSKLEKGEITLNLRASRAVLVPQEGTNTFLLRMFDTSGTALEKGVWQPLTYMGESEYPLVVPVKRARALKMNEMGIFQLREEARRIEQSFAATNTLAGLSAEDLRARQKSAREPLAQLLSPLQVEMHHQIAFSFACLGFTLIGIPLGIRSHRKETSIGVAVALVLVLVYYSFFIFASAIATKSQYHPWIFCWIPNFLFQLVGGFLLWRVNRQ